uniref:Clade I nitrous oxide reductase n=1 Tax=Macrostomum lignano TaxID=282301 RepID=A0A1I8F499_9PLAT
SCPTHRALSSYLSICAGKCASGLEALSWNRRQKSFETRATQPQLASWRSSAVISPGYTTSSDEGARAAPAVSPTSCASRARLGSVTWTTAPPPSRSSSWAAASEIRCAPRSDSGRLP